jgi:hypothetical protein
MLEWQCIGSTACACGSFRQLGQRIYRIEAGGFRQGSYGSRSTLTLGWRVVRHRSNPACRAPRDPPLTYACMHATEIWWRIKFGMYVRVRLCLFSRSHGSMHAWLESRTYAERHDRARPQRDRARLWRVHRSVDAAATAS